MKRPELPDCLTTSLGLRMPLFDETVRPQEKIQRLEEYLLLTAFTEGELAEELVRWQWDLKLMLREWDHLTGWEHLRRTRTETAVTQAKRQIRPELYDQIQDAEWMVKRLKDEAERMDREATRASRAYTLVTGS